MSTDLSRPPPRGGAGFVEFVALMAATMALGALGIDAMLPNLPAIGHTVGVADENKRQLIITVYLLAVGFSQVIFGPLADRYGRRPVIAVGLSLYVGFSLLAAFSRSFDTMLIARVLQGVGAASTRAIPISVIRDRYAGREMARVMSLTSLVFMAAPIMAPSLGQLVLVLASWPYIFGVLGALGGAVLVWTMIRLPETLHPEYRLTLTVKHIANAVRLVLFNRASLFYTWAMSVMFAGIMAYVGMVQQIFAETFHRPKIMPTMFALCAASMGAAAFLNSRIVERLGMRRISHTALLTYLGITGLHTVIAALGLESLPLFVLFQSATMACFALSISNFGAMAMEPVAAVAGIGASLQGFMSTLGGAAIGAVIGRQFNGTVVPLAAGSLACGLASLGFVLLAERGKLFRAHHADYVPPVHAEI